MYDTARERQTDCELMQMERKAKKPEIEWFFGVPFTAYCGGCKRMMVTGGVKPVNLIECPWCGTPVNWNGWGSKRN